MDVEGTPQPPPNAPQHRSPSKQLPKAAPSRRRRASRASPPPTEVWVFTWEARGWWMGGRPDKHLQEGRTAPSGATVVAASHGFLLVWLYTHIPPTELRSKIEEEDLDPDPEGRIAPSRGRKGATRSGAVGHRARARSMPTDAPPSSWPGTPPPRPRATAHHTAGGATPTEAAASDPAAPRERAERQMPRRHLPRRRPGIALWQPQATAREEGDGEGALR